MGPTRLWLPVDKGRHVRPWPAQWRGLSDGEASAAEGGRRRTVTPGRCGWDDDEGGDGRCEDIDLTTHLVERKTGRRLGRRGRW
ncbi:hypothetical protein E2562_020656 [Oryza meyeriana var. granulata]|uniref:Uncharacterized protein n=1 Tax=Oryza meyeriana var. granulata TaxID=110450 RepID=A0A6G1EB11_9ORYZ|nr:hypothetical protein E2562_020656 [Oryza meyeriana var. granulata]